MPSKGMGSRTQAEAKLNAAFKAVGRRRGDDAAYALPQIEKAIKVYYKDLKIGALKKPASMTKGSLVAKKSQLPTLGKSTSVPMSKLGVAKKAAPKKSAPKKAVAAKKPGMSKSGPRRASY